MMVNIPDLWIQISVSAFALFFVTRWLLRKLTVGNYEGRHVVITGCDTGFGNMATYKFDALGFNVYPGCLTEKAVKDLNASTSERVHPFLLDVAKTESVDEAVQFVKSKLPAGTGLWGIVNNAGVSGPGGFFEIVKMSDVHGCLNVNLFGVMNVTKGFLPLLRLSKGRIVNVASILGRFALFNISAYAVSKYGVEAFSDSIRRELFKTGVTVHIIEPGFFRTNITDPERLRREGKINLASADEEIRRYYGTETINKGIDKFVDGRLNLLLSNATYKVPDSFVHALTAKYPKHRYVISWDAHILFPLLMALPEWITDFLVTLMEPTPDAITKQKS